MHLRMIIWCSFLLTNLIPCYAENPLRQTLQRALAKEDERAIQHAADQIVRALGAQAGEPEVPDRPQPLPPQAAPLNATEIRRIVRAYTTRIETRLRGLDATPKPASLEQPLRAYAEIVVWGCALQRSQLDPDHAAQQLARRAADFLIAAQQQAEVGVFPFPITQKKDAAAFAAAAKILQRAKACQRLDQVTRNGWLISDDGEGGLQFDTAECACALLDLHALTRDARYLDAALRAGEWALQQPLVANWNYNSFSVALLARLAAATHDEKYRTAALKKAKLGVLPGQLTEGPYCGRWSDPHNARPAYHYIMLRALAELLAVLPRNTPDYAVVSTALMRGLRARNSDFARGNAMDCENALPAVIAAHGVLDPTERVKTQTDLACSALLNLATIKFRNEELFLGPRACGLFIEHGAARTTHARR